MKTTKCDICGEVLNQRTQRKSDIFDFDLCPRHKQKEKNLNMRIVYLNALKEEK